MMQQILDTALGRTLEPNRALFWELLAGGETDRRKMHA